ncbi:hypothetical protein V7O62_02825 [Methanolobus sp. ZRKC2]|uniref:hypothetical protein n=1 Tax=Methanolobus sp. ZRKC2 TaxID=3125783 RepID=UPI003244951D
MKKTLKFLLIGFTIVLLVSLIADFHFGNQAKTARYELRHATSDVEKSYYYSYLENPTESNKRDVNSKISKARDIIQENSFALKYWDDSWKSNEVQLDQIDALLTYTDGFTWESWRVGVQTRGNEEVQVDASKGTESLEIVEHSIVNNKLICKVKSKKDIVYADTSVRFYNTESSGYSIGLASNTNGLKKGDTWDFEVKCLEEDGEYNDYSVFFSNIVYKS